MALAGAAALVVALVLPAHADTYQIPPTKRIDSSANGYNYGYGANIVYDGANYYTTYCSSPDATTPGYPYDSIRFSASADGVTWSTPQVKLSVTDQRDTNSVTGKYEGAACDPSIVRFDAGDGAGPMYYMFYAGINTAQQYNDVLFVARASTYGGTYAKWTGSGWSSSSTAQPAPIVLPQQTRPYGNSYLGAAQPSVVVRSGVLHLWYTDDSATTTSPPTRRIYHMTSTDPTSWNWAGSTLTNVVGDSVDVKYDPSGSRFVMYMIKNPHTANASLVRYLSPVTDGVTFTEEVVCGTTCFPPYAHNVGVSGDIYGTINGTKTLIMFGLPYDGATTDNWGYWDMYGAWLVH